ncbi:MAG: phage terminase large subunit family protein [Deltaproteobacteria bacterium]|nr:phage terminase large subunit family protein [Deltaproteobacteria bacterium]
MDIQSSIVVNNPSKWLSPVLLKKLKEKGRLEYVGSFSRAEKKIMRTRRPIRPSKWAERHRIVTLSKLEGPWRNEVTPYLAGIMDAMALPYVRTVIICAANQVGKSECVHNFVGWCIDRSPGPVQYNYPDRPTAAENCKDRILPMIESSQRLRSYLTGYEDDKSSLRIKLLHMPIYLGWAGSPARMANRPIKVMIFDETDLYPDQPSKRETDPISQGEKRTITYQHDHKIIKISKPTLESAPISKALLGIPGKVPPEAQVVFDYWVKCPGCHKHHLMTFDQIKWDKEVNDEEKEVHPDPERMEALGLAWYECAICKAQWDDNQRNKAVRGGQWRTRQRDEGEKVEGGIEMFKYLEKERPRKIGVQVPSWISSFMSLSKVAAAFLRGRKDPAKLQDFINAHKAEAYRPKIRARKEDDILALRDDRDRGVVPSEPLVGLTAVADTQDDGFWYEIRAWGPWPDLESWQVREGFVPSVHSKDFRALEQVLFSDVYRDMDGAEYPVQLVFIDTGGHRTGEVYDWCRKHNPRVMGIRGHNRMALAWRWDKPGEKHRKKGRDIRLYGLNVNHYKDMLVNRLQISPIDPGAWHLHKDTTIDWARQMCSEVRNDEKGIWEVIESRDNHAWDISGYHMAMADIYLKHLGLDSGGKDGKKAGGRGSIKVARSKFMS